VFAICFVSSRLRVPGKPTSSRVCLWLGPILCALLLVEILHLSPLSFKKTSVAGGILE
jgi:hypothetical protein